MCKYFSCTLSNSHIPMAHTHITHLYLIAELKSQYKKESERLQQARDNYDHEVYLYHYVYQS